MLKIGIIGGISWESTAHYYKIMNEMVYIRLGGHHSLESIIYSLNFETILKSVHANRWDEVIETVGLACQKLEAAGADFIIITANAMHKIFADLARRVKIPILHIVDPTGKKIREQGYRKIGLLGTKVTMEDPFYVERLAHLFGIESIIPNAKDRTLLHSIIFDELTVGKINPVSKKEIKRMIEELQDQGVEGVILGCTELTLIISQKDTASPLFDTTQIHAQAAADLSIGI